MHQHCIPQICRGIPAPVPSFQTLLPSRDPSFCLGCSSSMTKENYNYKAGGNLMPDRWEENPLMVRARRLEEDVFLQDDWLGQYSLQFQGCDEFSEYRKGLNGRSGVRLPTKRVVRFRLCPSEEKGCTSGYGEYVVDLFRFLKHYSVYAFSQDKHMTFQDKKRLQSDMVCSMYRPPNKSPAEGGHEYFVGPYCANNGSDVFLGLFADDTCTVYADQTHGVETYRVLSDGKELRYANESIVDTGMISCAKAEPTVQTKHSKNKKKKTRGEVQANLLCKLVHSSAGKCEYRMRGISRAAQSNNACSYLEPAVRADKFAGGELSTKSLCAVVIAGCCFVGILLAVIWLLEIQRRRPENAGYGVVQLDAHHKEEEEETTTTAEEVIGSADDDETAAESSDLVENTSKAGDCA